MEPPFVFGEVSKDSPAIGVCGQTKGIFFKKKHPASLGNNGKKY